MTASSSSASSFWEGGIRIFTVVLAGFAVVEEDVSSGSATGIALDGLTRKPKAMSSCATTTNAAKKDVVAAGRLIEKMKYFPNILSLAWLPSLRLLFRNS